MHTRLLVALGCFVLLPLVLSAEDIPPRPIFWTMPLYPADLYKKKVSGRAVIDFVVDADGTIKDVTIVEETHKAFGKAASQTVQRWKFRAAKRDGVAVRWTMRVPIVFDYVKSAATRGDMPPTGAIAEQAPANPTAIEGPGDR